MRRLAGVVVGALALLLALPAAPAQAAFSQAAWTSPAGVSAPVGGSDDWTATVDERVTPQTVNLAGVFEHPNGVAGVTLVLEQSEYDEPPCAPAGFPASAPGAPSGPTAFSFDVLFPCNGTYVIRANAQSGGTLTQQPEQTALRLVLTVAVPAVPVDRLRAQATDGEAPQVALSWEPLAETDRDADFAGYDVERAVDGDDYEVIASLPDPEAAAFVDEAPAASGGAHRYRVVSVRRAGAQDDDGVVAAPDAAPEAEADLARSGDAGAGAEGGDGATVDGGGASGPRFTGSTSPRTSRRVIRTTGSSTGARTVTTVDTGFAETLPFDPNAQALPAGDPAVVAELEGDGEGTTKQTLALVAGGTAMFVGAIGVRRLLRKAASPYEVLQ